MQKRNQLKPTLSVQEIIERSTVKYITLNPKQMIATFRRWPIDKVRDACVEGIATCFWELEYLDWARETIEDLIEIGDKTMALQIIEKYSEVLREKAETCMDAARSYPDNAPEHLTITEVTTKVKTFGTSLQKWSCLLLALAVILNTKGRRSRLSASA